MGARMSKAAVSEEASLGSGAGVSRDTKQDAHVLMCVCAHTHGQEQV